MKKILGTLLLVLLLGGCASKFYRVTPEAYRDQVKTLGVLPVVVDGDSTILHPQRETIVELLRQSAQDQYLRLAARLGTQAGYKAVRPVIVEPQSAAQLLATSTVKTGKDGAFRVYQPNAAAVSELARSAGVDGLLLVVLNGVESREKRWERGGPRYLEGDFNEIQATVMVLAPTGEILWERPGSSGKPFVDLQYADFDEAYHNRTDQVAIRFITPDGLSRALKASDKALFDKEAVPALYRRLFDALAEGLSVGTLWRS